MFALACQFVMLFSEGLQDRQASRSSASGAPHFGACVSRLFGFCSAAFHLACDNEPHLHIEREFRSQHLPPIVVASSVAPGVRATVPVHGAWHLLRSSIDPKPARHTVTRTQLCKPYERTHPEQRSGYPDVNFLVNNGFTAYTGAPPNF